MMRKENEGFITVMLLGLLPFLVAGGFSLYVFLTYAEAHQALTQTCFRSQIKIQEQVRFSLLTLKALNSKAISLRARFHAARLRLIAALASYNYPLAAQSRAQMIFLQQQRGILDQQQKEIIRTGNNIIHSGQIALRSQLYKMAQERRGRTQYFTTIDLEDMKHKSTELAVRPDAVDIAPAYLLKNNFSDEQSLHFKWTLRMQTIGATRKFLRQNIGYRQGCSVTINSKEDSWPIVTRAVKSWWKHST